MRPRTIFGAIVIWLLSTIVLTILGFVATSFFLSARWTRPDGFMHRFQRFETAEAIVALNAGGKEALASYLGRLDSELGARHVLVDPSNRDVVTGADLSEFVRKDTRGAFPFGRRPPMIMVISVEESPYRLLIHAPPPPPVGPSDLLWNFLWLPILLALLTYLLAVHLASPLRKLTRAVEQFGHGDFSARVGIGDTRRDEIGELTRAFDAMANQIQTLMTAERRLLQDVSHELRSPLARLGFGVELARTSADRDLAIARVKKDLKRLNDLVDQLLQLTRSEGDPAAREVARIDLAPFLQELVEDARLEAIAGGSKLELQTEAGDELIVSGEPELLRRACENVLRNAIRHTRPGTLIEIKAFRRDDRIVIEVLDEGPGIPESDLDRVFQPFFRVESDRGRSSGGVGLGLSIARRAVMLHGGKISARNMESGLRVQIIIPALASRETP